MRRKILVLDGHPGHISLSSALCEAYANAARANGHQVRHVRLSQLTFDPDFGQAHYAGAKGLEPDLSSLLDAVEWADHLVVAFPLWWGGMPAKLKGLFDRILLPGRAFDPKIKRAGLPKPLLGGRSARILITSDTPGWALTWLYRNAILHQLKRHILHFVGVRPVRFSHLSVANGARADRIEAWLNQARRLGMTAS